MGLDELAYKYNTDKRPNRHGYTGFYERLLKNVSVSHLLEIGIYNGASHAMWLDYFPEATVYGIDIDRATLKKVRRLTDGNPRLILGLVDQGSREQTQEWAEKQGVMFDVIVDDGSHIVSHQIASFEVLWPFISEGGVYIIEDTYTSYWPNSKHSYVDQSLTCVEYFKAMVDELNLVDEGTDINKGYGDYNKVKLGKRLSLVQDTVDSIQFRNGTIVVYKR